MRPVNWKHYRNNLFYYYSEVLGLNVKYIEVTSIDEYSIYFYIKMYADSKKFTKVSWNKWNDITRQNHVQRLKDESKN